ncbi:hypothetical protein ACHAXT_002415 [Thalassiosira profunda]
MNDEFHEDLRPVESSSLAHSAENTGAVDQDSSCPTDAALMLGTDVECYFTACDQGDRKLGGLLGLCGNNCQARRKKWKNRFKKVAKKVKKVHSKHKKRKEKIKDHIKGTLNPFNDDFHPGGGCPVTLALPSDSGKACNYCLVQE